ncbi:30S ribosomal protein S6 alpha, chloroplastic-like isoform X2 [Tripterygium wilfordii]|nr:30S ribosomal protein S6 alpha, chloroplastic-like isoform X2 [Tripterygium wilfordii]
MASSSFTSTQTHSSNSLFCTKNHSKIPSPPLLSFTHSLKLFPSSSSPKSLFLQRKQSSENGLSTIKVQNFEFSDSLFEGTFGSGDDPTSPPGSGITVVEDKEEIPCPVGLRRYETMAVLRPDMAEEERLFLTQKYEELLVTGGGMYVEVFNRGVIPLAYTIKKRNKAGESNTYLDGIYLLFTYFTRPESLSALEETLKADDDVVRSSSFKIKHRKY